MNSGLSIRPIHFALLIAGGALMLSLTGCGGSSPAAAVAVLPPQGVAFDEPIAVSAPQPLVKKQLTEDVAPPPSMLEEVSDPLAKVEPGKVDDDGIRSLSFRELASFEYETIDPLSMLQNKGGGEPKTDIPESIQKLSGMRVKVDGYLMPTIFQNGKVETFLLTRSYITCCFGDVLNMNEVIDSTVGDDLEVSYFLSGQPVTVTGWLEVGEKKSEFGYVESIYRMVVEEVVERW